MSELSVPCRLFFGFKAVNSYHSIMTKVLVAITLLNKLAEAVRRSVCRSVRQWISVDVFI